MTKERGGNPAGRKTNSYKVPLESYVLQSCWELISENSTQVFIYVAIQDYYSEDMMSEKYHCDLFHGMYKTEPVRGYKLL